MKNFVRFGLGVLLAVSLAACGGDDSGDDDAVNPDAGNNGQTATISGQAVDIINNAAGVADVKVEEDGNPSNSTTTDGSGNFTITVPQGNVKLLFSKAGTWSVLNTYTVSATGVTGTVAGIATDGQIEQISGLLGTTPDTSKGIIFVNFPTPKAGVMVSTDATAEGSFHGAAGGLPADGSTTEADTSAVGFYNVNTGTAGITLSDAACSLAQPSVDVRAKTISSDIATCQ